MQKNKINEVYGVLGFPAKHSLSPVMHNAAFGELKIDAEYRIFEVPPQELEGFLKGLSKNNIAGINVTIPYKERVIPYLQKNSIEADLIGAVNTIKVFKDSLEGYNTDGEGFLRHVSEVFDFDPRDKKIAILGAGGASKAVCVYLAKTGPKRISVYDLNHEKVRGLIAHLNHCCQGPEFIEAGSIDELLISDADLLVNATPIGMKESDPSPVDDKFLHPGLFVYDLIYHHPQTALLKSAEKKGCLISNGLGMLLYQGMLSFRIWTGRNAPREVMEEALVSTLKKSHQV